MNKTKYLLCSMLAFLLLFPTIANAKLDITPNTQDQLIGILKGLAKDHAYKQWCENDCGQIHEITLSGKIESSLLNVSIMGNIIGKHNGVLPLFGAVPAIEITSLKNGLTEVPLVFYNKSYYTLLAPGPFHLTGKIKIDAKASTNISLPGPVGKITLDISDQEPLLKQVKLGQRRGSFQIVSATRQKNSEEKNKTKRNLRLNIKREFNIGRDKSFVYTINVVGANSGQVISIPLAHEEKILETLPHNAKIKTDRVEFTATETENRFLLQGEWTKKSIKLTAPEGIIQETWNIDCQGAYDCTFMGDVEKSVTATGHEWIPLPGQQLKVIWKELELLKGQSLVAQVALLDSKRTGDGLKQTLILDLASSSATQLYLDLPKTAIPTTLKYDKNKAPILKNNEGLIHLSIPKGKSALTLDWEIPNISSTSIPLPDLKIPVGKWFFWLTPNKHESTILTGGPSGSPVVLFWPRLGLCLFIGFLFLLAEKKLLKKRVTKSVLFLIMCAGYALTGPAVILGLIALLTLIRFISAVKNQRTILSWLFELGVLLILFITTISTYLFILNTAFFASTPLKYDMFCSANSPISGLYQGSALCWEIALTQPGQGIEKPYSITIPTLAIRIIYFLWALGVGFFIYTELKNLWTGLKNYYNLGTKPLFKKKTKS